MLVSMGDPGIEAVLGIFGPAEMPSVFALGRNNDNGADKTGKETLDNAAEEDDGDFSEAYD